MNLLDEEKHKSQSDKEKEDTSQFFEKKKEDNTARFQPSSDEKTAKHSIDPMPDYGLSSDTFEQDQNYKKSSRGPFFIVLFGILACIVVAWYFLRPGEPKEEKQQTLFEQPLVPDSTETIPDTTAPAEEVTSTLASLTESETRMVNSAKTLANLTSATLAALPSGSYPSLLSFRKSGDILIEIIAKTRSDLTSFQNQLATTIPTLKSNSESNYNFIGQPFYRGIYSGELDLTASGSANKIQYVQSQEFKERIKQIFVNSNLSITNIDESISAGNPLITIRATGSKNSVSAGISSFANANMNAFVQRANLTFDTIEPINDYVVVLLSVELTAQP